MIFRGKFEPPIYAFRRTPVPITSDGTMELDPSGIRVIGHRAASCVPRVMLVLAMVVGATVVQQLLFGDSAYAVPIGTCMLAGSLMRGVRGARRELLTVLYPWSGLFDVKRLDDGLVILRMRSASASGDLFFRPDDGANALVEMLDFARGAEDLTRIAA
jgi:hypothetical protein